MLPAAERYGIGVIPWSPLHGGLLGGALRKIAEGTAGRSAEGRSNDALNQHRPAIEAYEKLCADLGHDPAELALAWVLSRPAVTAPIVGPRTIEQVEASLRAFDVTLDELFPPIGKGGPGPEAWAW